MKKINMSKIALLGLTSGLLLASQANAAVAGANQAGPTLLSGKCGSHGCNGATADRNIPSATPATTLERTDTTTSTTTTKLSESDLKAQLNERSKALYESLDTEGKALALRLANTPEFSDKNEAVKAAAKQMADKHSMSK